MASSCLSGQTASPQSDPRTKSCLWSLFVASSLICAAYFIGSAVTANDYKQQILRRDLTTLQHRLYKSCQSQGRPFGSEALPEGIVARTSNLEMRPLWSSRKNMHGIMNHSISSRSLLAIAVGIKQKEIVNRIVEQFPSNDFVVMLFHYDGFVDEWRRLEWSNRAIHVSVPNQTKWWFAKRFLHPNIVAEYNYIFLWDEDIGVENFHATRYLSIVKDEGLEISQPAIDPSKSEVHYPITARVKNVTVHRRTYKFKGSGRCDEHSTNPPCIGWVEMMAPVFSRAAWRCVWYLIQNDLIHAWGLDKKLGYCAQGKRSKNVGVVDSEYIVHLNLTTLGTPDGIKAQPTSRFKVRRQSFREMQTFARRWENAAMQDTCWTDPY